MIGELVLRGAVRLAKRRHSNGQPAGEADPQTAHAAYIRWQFESSQELFSRYPDFDVRGKEVLEIGCGTGGRAAYLASKGAKRVVGIDINAEEIAIATTQCPELYPETSGRLEFLTCAENGRLEIGQFDIVLLVDCMEHVVSPPAMMRLAHSYTKPGGKCYFSCIGYYHHHGAHMDLIPFVNVFFSDETIMNVTRWWVSRPDYHPHRFDSNPPALRWQGIYDLRDRPGEHLNKLTIRDMKKLVKHSIFAKANIKVIGIGEKRRWLAPLNWLKHVPVVQEALHSYVVAEFQR